MEERNEEVEATETTEMLGDVERLEEEREEGGRRGRGSMNRVEFCARGGFNQACGQYRVL